MNFLFAETTTSSRAARHLIHEGLKITHLVVIYFISAFVIYLLLLLIGRALKRRFKLPLGWTYQIFCISIALFVPTKFPGIDFAGEYHTTALLIIAGACMAIGAIRHYFFDLPFRQKQNTQVPKFLSEIVSITILIAAILFTLQNVYSISVPGLLAGAGVAGIILGFALQDTLTNIFSGFAIYFGGQFKPGDWLLIEDKHAKIMEINWRSTRLRTPDDVYLDIPNSNITKQTVVNYNYPTSIHGIRLEIGLGYEAPPNLVKKILIDAALDSPHVLRDPAPNVFLSDFADWSVVYQLRFWLDDHAHYNSANSHIRTTLWYSLRRHNLSIPYSVQHELQLERPKTHVEDRNLIRDSISKAVFASCLSPGQLDQIVRSVRIVCFGAGESIIRQGAEAGPMYVLVNGRAEVWIESNGVRTSVAVLEADACIGENSVLTGEKRTATILALEDCLAVEVDKAILAPIIEASPHLLESLSELLAQRMMKNEGIVNEAANTSAQTVRHNYKAGFLKKLRSFFEV